MMRSISCYALAFALTTIAANASDECPQIASPAAETCLTGSTMNLSWDEVEDAEEYSVEAGDELGGHRYGTQTMGKKLCGTVTGLPVDGSRIYTRLWCRVNGSWRRSDGSSRATDRCYRAHSSPLPTLISPDPGSVLPGSDVTFNWSWDNRKDQEYQEFWVYAGASQGGYEYFNASVGLNRSVRITNLPTDGTPVWIELWYKRDGSWWSATGAKNIRDYQYKTIKPEITSPTPGRLTRSNVTFLWTSGMRIAEYWLQVGTTRGGTNIFNASTGGGLAQSVNINVEHGTVVYVRLWWRVGNTWWAPSGAGYYTDYLYSR
jgi:hypothetical protein